MNPMESISDLRIIQTDGSWLLLDSKRHYEALKECERFQYPHPREIIFEDQGLLSKDFDQRIVDMTTYNHEYGKRIYFEQLAALIHNNKLSRGTHSITPLFGLADCIGAPERVLQFLAPLFLKEVTEKLKRGLKQVDDQLNMLISVAFDKIPFSTWLDYCAQHHELWGKVYQPARRMVDLSTKTLKEIGLYRSLYALGESDISTLCHKIGVENCHQIETFSLAGHTLTDVDYAHLLNTFSGIAHLNLSGNKFSVIPEVIERNHVMEHFSIKGKIITIGNNHEPLHINLADNPIAPIDFSNLIEKHAKLFPLQTTFWSFDNKKECILIAFRVSCVVILVGIYGYVLLKFCHNDQGSLEGNSGWPASINNDSWPSNVSRFHAHLFAYRQRMSSLQAHHSFFSSY